MKILWTVLGIVVLLLLIVMLGYNRLVKLNQNVDAQWAQVQNQYQRRMDLIPNLVKTVQGSANFEKSTLENVVQARASVGRVQINSNTAPTDAAKLEEFEKAQGALGSALQRLLVVAENYPQLRSTSNFATLQTQIEGTENRIAVERQRFNDEVRSYNTAVQAFPGALYAGAFGFAPKPYFTGTVAAQTAPNVQFDFSNAGTPAPATQK